MAVIVTVLLLAGLWQTGSGAWIYVKAQLAQVLLQRAWAGTLNGNTHAKPWPWADTWPVARLVVPTLGIDQIVLEGAYGRTLAFGPGRVESSEPAQTDMTMILTGHRDTHFRFLEQLQPGEPMMLQARTGAWHRFTVRDHQIVDARTASIRSDENGTRLVLVTCYPFGGIKPNTPFRYVVTAELEELADGENVGKRLSWKTFGGFSSQPSISTVARD
jgi:sortase A